MKRNSRTWRGPSSRRRQAYPPIIPPYGYYLHGFGKSRYLSQQEPHTRMAIRFHQQLDEQRVFSLGGDKQVWTSLCKLLLAVSPLLLLVQWQLMVTYDRYCQAVANHHAAYHVLLENQAALDALRSRLSSPERIRPMAAEKLSLYAPDKGQIEIF